jgi:vitamin B12 transporter
VQSSYDGYPLSGKFNHAEAYINHELGNLFQLLAGVSYQTFKLPIPDSANILFSPYASLIFHSSGLTLEAGGRYNKHNRYGDNFTYSINPSYLYHNIKVFADLSTGFRAPSIGELFGPFGANPYLTPEKSSTAEAGVQIFSADKKVSVIASYFNRDIKNIITYTYPDGYINRDRQKDHGIETEIRIIPGNNWNIRASYTFVEGAITQKEGNKDTTFDNLIRRPKHSFDLSAGYQLTSRLYLSSTFQWVGKRNDIYYDPVTYLPEQKQYRAYGLWNAYAEYHMVHNNLVLFADVKNITNNKDYVEVYGYNVQGITVNGGVRFTL